MGRLYDARMSIQKIIDDKGLDQAKTCGSIGLKAGMLLAMVKPDTPDDEAKLSRLKSAASEVLGASI
jgi:hypothetical protein